MVWGHFVAPCDAVNLVISVLVNGFPGWFGRVEVIVDLGSGEFLVGDPSRLNEACRKLKRYFTENLAKELRLREGHINRKRIKKFVACQRLKKRQRKELDNG